MSDVSEERSIDLASKEMWDRAKGIFLSTLASEEERSQAERYFGMITSITRSEGAFLFYTTNDFTAELLQNSYAAKLKSSFILAGAPTDLTISFKKDLSTHQTIVLPTVESTPTVAEDVTQPNAFVSTMPLTPDYTFDEFVQGPSNSFALSAAKAVVKSSPGKRVFYNPLFIHGGTGLGKTHLMQAIGNEMKKNNPSLAICYLTAETFLNEYINSLTNGQSLNFRNRYRSVDVLLIDDVQFLNKGKDNFQEEFFNTFNHLQQNQKQIVMTSDVAPSKMQSIQSRLISRFEGGMVQEIESPSYETRLAILKKKSEGMELRLPDTALEFIADNVKSHVRAMEGALIKVTHIKMADPTIVLSNDVLQHILKDVIEKEQTIKNLTIEEIQSAVAKKYNITTAQILSSDRPQSLVTPRQMAMYLSRKLTTKSLKEVAVAFDKQHATILYGVKSFKQHMDENPELRLELEEVVSSLGYQLTDVI